MADMRWSECPVVIPYMGGKFELSRQLVPMLPPHSRYIEVFAGGLSMFFRKKLAKWTVVNDKDSDISNLYESIRKSFEEFKWNVMMLIKSRTVYDICKANINRTQEIDIPDPVRAAEYYFVLKNAFNNNLHLTMSKDCQWNTHMLDDVMESKKKFNDITIENMDFAELIKRYEPRDDDLWYLDPPYYIATNRGDYYRHNFTEDDHDILADCVRFIDEKGGKFMVSYDDKTEVRLLYEKFYITEIHTQYSGNNHIMQKPRIELVITNYKPRKQEGLFE